ncbi:GNAT family N-acetyltransferase [Paenibacillus vulneris]|uniref:GNAT family N-acetyltransferase n=1 Tax=Paenibacillus vulneris TaxID=1133364 RepID=A0ABW3UZ03_9BACL|nr:MULTISPECIES: GNAT family N-acetyltransferase [unclassified Paenibacillus]MBE1442341.1 diamine N-acetyltransferase [Paenibacillus sp. OAS669]
MRIQLKAITSDNWEQCVRLSVHQDQERFVAPNVYSILQSKFEPDKEPLAIYNENTMVGLVMYGCDPEDDCYWIVRLMIDKKHQGKGYGRAALLRAIELIRSLPDCSPDIKISYNPDNTAAEKLYESLGFRKTGEVISHGTHKEVVAKLALG